MTKHGDLDRRLSDPQYRRIYQQEKLILEAMELIAEAMEDRSVSRSVLARLMNRTRGYVTQLLSGSKNLTLRTLADALMALGYEVTLSKEPIGGRIDAMNWTGETTSEAKIVAADLVLRAPGTRCTRDDMAA